MLRRAREEPDAISFADWTRGCRTDALWVHYKRRDFSGHDIGWASSEFASYFCQRTEDVFRAAPDANAMAQAFRAGAYHVRFLRMHNLNDELYQFLKQLDYPEEKIAFIRQAPKIFPGRVTRTDADTTDRYFTPELKAEVRYSERLLFALFPEYDV